MTTRDPYEHLADMIVGESTGVDYATFLASTPYPVEGGAPYPAGGGAPEWQGDDDAVPPDDQRPADADEIPTETIQACAAEPQNDTGNGQRLLNYFAGDILHVRDAGWHGWKETRWMREGGKEIAVRCAHRTAARIVLEADHMAATPSEQQAIEDAQEAMAALDEMVTAADEVDADGKKKEPSAEQKAKRQRLKDIISGGRAAVEALKARQIARRKYAVSSGNAGKIKGMLEQAEPYRTVEIKDLDADKLAFNVNNGTLFFVCTESPDPDAPDHSNKMIKRYSVELRPHNRADNITKVAPVDYNKDAKCPTFDIAVNRFQPIEAVRSFLQRYHGYALTGLTGEQCLVFNYGTGSNWKSTCVEIIARIMGDYCATIAFESLAGDAQKSGSQATPDIARLPGARLVRASEPERGVQFKEALIKSLTGGEPMLTRHNFKDFFEFRPDFKLILSGNHKPEVGGVDHGIWRRIRFVPWPVTIADNEKRQMDEVIAELWAERSGILNWLVAGALDYLNNGLRTPKEVLDATAEYRDEMDPVGSFLGMCVVSVPPNADGSATCTVPARELYDAFVSWGLANAVRPWKEKSFATAMSQKGFAKERHRDGQRYLNIKLNYVPKRQRLRDGDPPPHGDNDIPDDEVPFSR
jgi:putative DNA primase/helicase